MQVVILAGGIGSRIQSVSGGQPKIMLRVGGRPFVEQQLALLVRSEMRNILLCTGHGSDVIENHVGDGAKFGVSVRYSREDPYRLLGTGGALVNALPLLEEQFMVMYGDAYLTIDYREVAAFFRHSTSLGLMCVFRNEGRWDRSNARVEKDRVVFYSKTAHPDEADFIDYGLNAFRRSVIEAYRASQLPLDLAHIQSALVAQGSLAAFPVKERFYEIGKPEGLADLDAYLTRTGATIS